MPHLTDAELRDPLTTAASFLDLEEQSDLRKVCRSMQEVINHHVREQGRTNLESNFHFELQKLIEEAEQLNLVDKGTINLKVSFMRKVTEFADNLRGTWDSHGIPQKIADMSKLRALTKLVKTLRENGQATSKQAVIQYAHDTGTESAITKHSTMEALNLSLYNLATIGLLKMTLAIGLPLAKIAWSDFNNCEDYSDISNCFKNTTPPLLASLALATTYSTAMVVKDQWLLKGEYSKKGLNHDEDLSRSADKFACSLD